MTDTMCSELLTIVIPTRDRPEFLEKCLRSVFDDQTALSQVIVSDNSTVDQAVIGKLQDKYRFAYVRQSGQLSQDVHLNICCLELPSTRWVLLLHDDDELYPDGIRNLQSFLPGREDAGIVIAGIQHIDRQGAVRGQWMPKRRGTFKGEDGLLRLGLDGWAFPPATVFNVEASRQMGGFIGINGVASDHTFALKLAYRYGVAFFTEIVGRYRSGPHQIFHFSNTEEAEAWLDFTIREAELVRTIGCSDNAVEQLLDYRTWSVFLAIAPSCLESHASLLFRVVRKCLDVSPGLGEWQKRARESYPFLFSRFQWFVYLIFKVARTVLPAPLRRRLRTAR
jgi:glycosyltransferase involved in cell wall biosynthesis